MKLYLGSVATVTNAPPHFARMLKAENTHRNPAFEMAVRQGRNEVPKKLNGWNVRKDAHGHYRMYKRLNGRLIGKYVGRVWDNVKALQVAGGV